MQNIILVNPDLTHIKIAGIAMGDLNWLPPMGPQGEYDLQELDISETGSFFDLGPVGQYINLRVLKASGNRLEFAWALEQLTQLEVLDLSNNNLVDVSPLQMLQGLTQLTLSGNSNLQAFEVQNIILGNPGLTHINIAGIAMDDLNWLPPMGPQCEYDLQELDISETGSFIDLDPVGQYINLRVLKAAGNHLEFAWPLEQLAKLEILDLSNNDLRSVLMLGDLVNLTSLDLRGNNNIQCDELDALEAMLLPGVLLRPLSCIFMTPPTVTILSPVATQTYFSTGSIDFVATAFDAEDGSLDELIQWSSNLDGDLGIGGTLIASLSAGEHVIMATVVDSHENRTTTSLNISVLPNTVPELTINSIQDGAIFNEDEAVLLAADANDTEDGNISFNIQWTSSLDGFLGVGANIQPPLSIGKHIITASISDSAEATATQTVNLTINALPALSLQSPLSGALYMLQEAVEMRATASDPEDGDISANIQWSSSIDGSLGTGGVILKTLSLGTHILTATITDSAGGMNSVETEIVIDQIDLKVRVFDWGRIKLAALRWSGSRTSVDIYKDGVIVDKAGANGTAIYRFKDIAVFKVCESGTNYCSVEVVVP